DGPYGLFTSALREGSVSAARAVQPAAGGLPGPPWPGLSLARLFPAPLSWSRCRLSLYSQGSKSRREEWKRMPRPLPHALVPLLAYAPGAALGTGTLAVPCSQPQHGDGDGRQDSNPATDQSPSTPT